MLLRKSWASLLAVANFIFATLIQSLWFFSFWKDSAPVVLRDELLFSSLAVVENGLSPYSNSAFSALYSLSSQCGPDFLVCGRLTNIALWLGFAALISVIIFLSKSLPVAIFGFWVSTSAISFYSVTFLPEIMYYVLVAVALFLMTANASSSRSALIISLLSGFIFGIAVLTKPHAVFVLVIATVATLVIYSIEGRANRVRLIQGLVPIVFAFLTRTLAELIFSDRNILDIFGRYLGGGDPSPNYAVSLPIEEPDPDEQIAVTFFDALVATFLPYFTAALFLYLPPLVMAIVFILRERQGVSFESVRLFIFSFSASGMLIVSYIFGAYVTVLGDDHTDRLLLRYSEFLVPLTWLVLVWAFSKKEVQRRQWLAGAIPLGIGAIFVLAGGFSSTTFVSSDSLILFSFLGSNIWFALFVIGVLGIFLRASIKNPGAFISFVAITTLALMVTSYQQIYRQSSFHVAEAQNWSPISMDVQEIDSGDIIFLGSKRATIASIMLNSRRLDSEYALVNGYSEVPADWLQNYDFAVISTEIYPPRDSKEIVSSEDGTVTLYELRSENGIEKDLYLESNSVDYFSNTGVVTDWGYWVDGDSSEITFKRQLGPSEKISFEVIRHQLTSDPAVVFEALGEEPLTLDLPVAGRVYEIEVTIGAQGLRGFRLSYGESVKIGYVEGMEDYSFGIGRITVSN